MAAQYTPGPWQFGIQAVNFQTAELATVFQFSKTLTEDGLSQGWAYITANRPCHKISSEEREANGRLMAAAPDLLEALKEARETLFDFAKEMDSAAWMVDPFYADAGPLARINAAIAKAEGRQ